MGWGFLYPFFFKDGFMNNSGKPNKECKCCGKMYYGCKSCDEVNAYFAWRTICCSRECFQEYMLNKIKIEV